MARLYPIAHTGSYALRVAWGLGLPCRLVVPSRILGLEYHTGHCKNYANVSHVYNELRMTYASVSKIRAENLTRSTAANLTRTNSAILFGKKANPAKRLAVSDLTHNAASRNNFADLRVGTKIALRISRLRFSWHTAMVLDGNGTRLAWQTKATDQGNGAHGLWIRCPRKRGGQK